MAKRTLPGNRVHFIAIGGVGMSALAYVLQFRDCQVSGSDIAENRLTQKLAGLGAKIAIGHKAQNVEDVDLVVVSSAVRDDNVELLRARHLGIPIWHRAQMLDYLLTSRRSVVVAGTHGKTTTTSMIATVAYQAGMDPTLLIGGEINDFGGNAHVGKSDLVIAEGDESDGSLIELSAHNALINNIDADHLDHFKDLGEIEDLFRRFIGQVDVEGEIWMSADWESCRKLVKENLHPAIRTYALEHEAELNARDIEMLPEGSRFTLCQHGEAIGNACLRVPGMHNIHNALGAAGIAHTLGVEWSAILTGLEQYLGVKRRFETIGKVGGVRVIDDYAHHPAEILATMNALKRAAPGRKIGVFQPHRYSRTAKLMQQFATAFPVLDKLIVTDVYGAGEPPIEGVTGEVLAQQIRQYRENVQYVANWMDIPTLLADEVHPGDTLITLGAGTVNRIGPMLLELLQERGGSL
jgi:UDP-N-acetylmuramate--alanine ligase